MLLHVVDIHTQTTKLHISRYTEPRTYWEKFWAAPDGKRIIAMEADYNTEWAKSVQRVQVSAVVY